MKRNRIWVVYETRRGAIKRVFKKAPSLLFPGWEPGPGEAVLEVNVSGAERERIWRRKVRNGQLVQV